MIKWWVYKDEYTDKHLIIPAYNKNHSFTILKDTIPTWKRWKFISAFKTQSVRTMQTWRLS